MVARKGAGAKLSGVKLKQSESAGLLVDDPGLSEQGGLDVEMEGCEVECNGKAGDGCACPTGTWGPKCLPCACGDKGTCDEGKSGTGACACDGGSACDDGDPCTVEHCSGGSSCVVADAANGTDCGGGATCQAGVCSAGLAQPSPAQVFFTEIMQNPLAVMDQNGEWFELYNATSFSLSLEGCVLSDDGSDALTVGPGAVIAPGDYVVFASSADPALNGNLPSVTEAFGGSINLGNASDSIKLTCAGKLVDEVTWDDGVTFPDPSGASMALCPGFFTPAANDDGANWSASASAWPSSTDKGSPGADNQGVSCP